MKRDNTTSGVPGVTPGGTIRPTSDWHDHEHVSEQVQLEAQKLVECAGSLELAKKAIDVVEGCQPCDGGSGRARTLKANDKLKNALEHFETQLETPIVSGDVAQWLTHGEDLCAKLGQLLQETIQTDHAASFKSIRHERPEQANQVEKLQAADQQLLADFEHISLCLGRLHDRAESIEPDERKVVQPLEEVIKQGLAFVISARRQEVAIDTWFMEAFNRVDGNQD